MRKTAALIFVCISFFSSGLFGQIVPFGSPGWKYFHQLPAAAPCSEPPNYASTSSFSWKSPQYNTVAVPGWVNNSDTLPMGYAVNTSNIYGGLPIKKILTFNDPAAKPTTLYIRRTITLTSFSRASYSSFTLRLRADDGVRVYFNETEVANYNLPSGTLGANISASTATGTDTTSKVFQIPNTFPIHPESPDKITITAEIHQSTVGLTPNCSTNSSDLFIDMQLSGILSNMPASLTRGPYLQLPLPTGIQVRWKTNLPETGKVCVSSSGPIGNSNPGTCTIDTESVTNHKLFISNLLPNTKYFYSVQNSNDTIYKKGADFYFITPPQNVDTSKTTKIWVTGDIGQTKHSNQRPKVLAGFNKFRTEQNIGDLNLWLLLGDVCNETGSEIEYDTAFFATHDSSALKIMKQTALLSCVGNHDYYSTNAVKFSGTDSVSINAANQFVSGRYTNIFYGGLTNNLDRKTKKNSFFDLFSFPINNFGQKYSTSSMDSIKAYYSYDHNNIHFICLDSYGFYNNRMLFAGIPDSSLTDTSANSQFLWLRNDLKKAKTNPDIKWTIMYWHHSPYTRGGGHFSDSLWNDEFILYGIRDKLIRFLDKGNFDIDLILNGHSHVYSRSKLMKGHYGLENTFDKNAHNKPLLDPQFDSKASSNGKYNSDTSCAYLKSRTNAINEGIVYVLTGSSSQLQRSEGTSYNAIVGHKALNGASFTNHSNIYQTRGNIQMEKGGSVYIEVKDNRLDAKFVQEDGTVGDNFTIFKDINKNDIQVDSISFSEFPSESPQLQILKPNWPKVTNFTVTGPNGYSQTFQNAAISISNPQIGPIYTVKDQYNCLTQNFRFNFSNQCWRDVTINNTFDTSVIQNINSSGTISSGSKIIGTSKVNFNAAHGIFLTPGIFNVEKNSIFSGKVQPPPCQ